MSEKIENSFKEFISALQVARLYPNWHPQFKKSIDKAYDSLLGALEEREQIVIGIIGEELAFEKEIFFELSKFLKPMVLYLKERGIERIEFFQGLDIEELSKFISFLVRPKGEVMNEPQEELAILGIRNIGVGKIKAGSAALPEELQKSMSYLKLYEESLDKVTHSLESVLNGEELDRLSLRVTVTNVMENLLGPYQDFLNLGTIKRYDSRTFFHMVNVSILAMYFCSKIGFPREDVIDIGSAALFHDIGKISISRKILKETTRLKDEEFDKIKSHVIIGAEIMLKYVQDLGILSVVVCFEHHLRYDLSGYPKISLKQKPNIASSIVSICDVYDALSQRRSYKNNYPSEMIYAIMIREKGTAFDPVLLDKYFQVIGVWPLGTIVSLSDSRIAVVRDENPDDIYSPKVEVIFPEAKKEIIDLRESKDKIKIERSLNPLTEGKEYLPLANPAIKDIV